MKDLRICRTIYLQYVKIALVFYNVNKIEASGWIQCTHTFNQHLLTRESSVEQVVREAQITGNGLSGHRTLMLEIIDS